MSITDQSDSKTYKQGQSVESRAVFRDIDGELADPTIVTCEVKAPSGSPNVTAYTYGVDAIVRESEGVYHFWIDTAAAFGLYKHGWKGDGPNITLNWREFYAEEAELFV